MQTVLDNLTALAIQLRNTDDAIRTRMTEITGLGLAGLVKLGFGSAPNPDNPGNMSDAEYVLTLYGYLSTNAGVYFGLVQQGGTGGTGAMTFDFNQGLSPVWNGQ
jgi:hypothetical protein